MYDNIDIIQESVTDFHDTSLSVTDFDITLCTYI